MSALGSKFAAESRRALGERLLSDLRYGGGSVHAAMADDVDSFFDDILKDAPPASGKKGTVVAPPA